MLTYGTLKIGHYNHDRFDCKTIKKVEKLEGYRMYSLGSYPMIVKTNDKDDVIYDLEVIESPLEHDIITMEEGAGYVKEIVKIDNEELILFIANERNAARLIYLLKPTIDKW